MIPSAKAEDSKINPYLDRPQSLFKKISQPSRIGNFCPLVAAGPSHIQYGCKPLTWNLEVEFLQTPMGMSSVSTLYHSDKSGGLLCKVGILTVGPPDAPNYFYTDIGQSWPTSLLLALHCTHSQQCKAGQSVFFLAEEKKKKLPAKRDLHIANIQGVWFFGLWTLHGPG